MSHWLIAVQTVNIAQIIRSLNLNLGGPPRSVMGLCTHLAKLGHNVTVVTGSIDGWTKGTLNRSFANGGRLRTLVGKPTSRTAVSILPNVDIVHFMSLWNPHDAILAARCKRLGVPYILSPRGQLDAWSMQQKSLKKRVYLLLVGRRFIDHAQALHLLNENEREGARALRIKSNFFVCPNGIDTAAWQSMPKRGLFKQAVGIDLDQVLIVFMARLHKGKGPALLARAFANVARTDSRAHLAICGPDYGEQAGVEKILRPLVKAGRASIHGMVTGELRRSILADADILAQPSYQEAHPRTVIEAAYLGKALLITQECRCPEFEHDRAAVVVRPNVTDIARGLEALLADALVRKRLGETAARIARDSYTWDIVAESMARHYRDCLDGAMSAQSLQNSTQ